MVGVMSFMALPSFIFANPYFGPQGLEDDFLWFGNADYPISTTQGINLDVDYTSVSHQSVIALVTFDDGYIDERQITRFYITANGRIVDFFDPAWDIEREKWKRSYNLRIALADWNTGSRISLRIVAVTDQEVSPIDPTITNKYVVGWSNQPEPFLLKDLPVVDKEAIGVLEAIYAKLSEMLALLEKLRLELLAQLKQIEDAIKKIYEVSPQTQAKFDAALAELQGKLPTEQIKDQAEQIQREVENSANRINNMDQALKFGEINWMGIVVTPALDLRPYTEQVELLRKILQVTLWCEFFYFVILVLRPRLTV